LWCGVWARALARAQEVVHDREFWKFLVMGVLTVNLKSIFQHLGATLPKYIPRAFGCRSPVGLVFSINPFSIIVLVPLVSNLGGGERFSVGLVFSFNPFAIIVSVPLVSNFVGRGLGVLFLVVLFRSASVGGAWGALAGKPGFLEWRLSILRWEAPSCKARGAAMLRCCWTRSER
jgi:hypothetical protein